MHHHGELIVLSCVHCASIFEPKLPIRRQPMYCSGSCKALAYQERKAPKTERNCKICGVSFMPKRYTRGDRASLCSDSCKSLAYQRRNPEATKRRLHEWAIAHPEVKAQIESRRRARMAGSGGTHTVEEWLAKCAEYDHRCAYCGVAKPLTRDHKQPISRGGRDSIDNIVPACLPCNAAKGNRVTITVA